MPRSGRQSVARTTSAVLLQGGAASLKIMPRSTKETPMPNSRGVKDACNLLDADHRAVKSGASSS